MAISFYNDASIAINSRTLAPSATWSTGDVVIYTALTWDQGLTQATPTASGLSFPATPNAEVNSGGHPHCYAWACTATAGGTGVAINSTAGGGSSIHNASVIVLPSADGYSLAATPNAVANPGAGAMTASLTGTNGSIGIVACADWNGGSGATRAWLLSATETLYQFSSGDTTHYVAFCTLTTTGSNTVGLSTPTSTGSIGVVAVEVLAGGGPPAATRTPLVSRYRNAVQRATLW